MPKPVKVKEKQKAKLKEKAASGKAGLLLRCWTSLAKWHVQWRHEWIQLVHIDFSRNFVTEFYGHAIP